MKKYTIIVHDDKGHEEFQGTANELMNMYFSNTRKVLYDILGLKVNLNKRELFEELGKLAEI